MKNANSKEHEINEKIGFQPKKEVRVIDDDGQQLGIMQFSAALNRAYEKEVDLVLMSAQGETPVCKIMDYGKFKFEREKKEKEAKKRQKVVEIKEIQLTYLIDTNDFQTKLNHARRFLADGNKVKVMMKFKGRQISRVETGRELLVRFQDSLTDLGTPEKSAALEGRNLIVFIAPNKTQATMKGTSENGKN